MTWFSTPPHCTLPKKNVQLNMDSQGMVRVSSQSMIHPVLAHHIPVRIKHIHCLPQTKIDSCTIIHVGQHCSLPHAQSRPTHGKSWILYLLRPQHCEPDLSSGSQCTCEPTILSIESQSTEVTSEAPETPHVVPESWDGSG